MDFSEQVTDGWEALWSLAEDFREQISDGETEAHPDFLLWMLRRSSDNLKANLARAIYVTLLETTLRCDETADAAGLLLDLGGERAIDRTDYFDNYTILQQQLVTLDQNLGIVLSRGPDLHLSSCDLDYSQQQESSTSLAMYSSCAFTFWRSGLCTLRIDTKDFIEKELERSPLVDAGWKADTLLALFEYDLEQAYRPIRVKYCHSCGTRNYGVRIQPFWRHLLERVRLGIGTDMSSEIGPKAGGTLESNTNRSLKVQGTIA